MDTDDGLKRKAFVSYVREDQDTVMRLVAELRGAGVEVWWDKEGLRAQGGARWKKAIEKAIEAGDYFVACFSDAYWEKAAKSYMSIEIATAIERLRYAPPEARWFIPVRLTDCPVPEYLINPDGAPEETLADLQWIDLWRDWDGGVLEVIESILPRGPVPHDLQVELLRLKSPHTYVRRAAASALGEIGSDAATNTLIKALNHGVADVREAAARALGKIGSDAATEALINALSDAGVRVAAAWALGNTGNDAAAEALTNALDDQYASMREAAARALGNIGGDAAVPNLATALNDEDAKVCWAAALALRKIGSDAATEVLTNALNDEDAGARVGRAAARALIAACVPEEGTHR